MAEVVQTAQIEVWVFDTEVDRDTFENGQQVGGTVQSLEKFEVLCDQAPLDKWVNYKLNGKAVDYDSVYFHFGVDPEEGMY